MPSKIAVVGDVNGQFQDVLRKINGLHAKNAFAFAIVAGNLFADPSTSTYQDEENLDALMKGEVEVSLPVYFALGSYPLPEGVTQRLESSDGELCPNLFFLGKRTTMKTTEGIRIVALGGALGANIPVGVSKDKYPPFYNEDDAKVLKGANHSDILITSEWPSDITIGSNTPLSSPSAEPISRKPVADLCLALKPKYHFSLSPGMFYEREPFFHPRAEDETDTYRITRFISLSQYGSGAKWIYAFTLDPSGPPPNVLPSGVTACPLSLMNRKRAALASQEASYRFSDVSHGDQHERARKKRKRPHSAPAECFFCLSNPNVATHLVTSIGDEAYLTIAKGPLSTSQTFSNLGFPCHMLIIPMTHSPTLGTVDEASRAMTYTEMNQYRKSLNTMLRSCADSELGSVTWEISRSGGIHTHWQFLPIAADTIRRGLVEAALKVEAENQKFPPFCEKNVGDGSKEDGDFFRVLLWAPASEEQADEVEKSFLLPLDASFRFDLQFGRKVLAKLLGLEKRLRWQDCGQSEQEEVADADHFKKAFKDFDFTLKS